MGPYLAHQFQSALSDEYKKSLSNCYVLPDPASLTTKSHQLATLRIIHTLAVKEQATINDDRVRIEKAFRRMLGKTSKTETHQYDTRNTKQDTTPNQADSYKSPAEQTIQRHHIDPTLVETLGGPRPHDKESGFTSPYPVDFPGCLGCGATDHYLFKDCPHKDD